MSALRNSSIAAGLLTLALASQTAIAASPYENDPDVVAQLADLGSGQSLMLPPVNVQAGGLEAYNMDKRGPGQRDYCNKMPYAPDRQTALYAGGNHASPHRMNDVWEYHLGSNTWHLLYGPDGGNAGRHKGAYFLTSRTLVREPDKRLNPEEKAKIEAYRQWWNANVVLRDGHLETTQGGPIMPAHTWDAFTYDAHSGKLLWGMGASPAGKPSTYAYFAGKSAGEVAAQLDSRYTPMWMFDPATRQWQHYRTSQKHAELRGMGATMAYLPDLQKTLWYVAAQNVSPHAFEMWLFDVQGDTWAELKPNGGKSISTLATQEEAAPLSEVQTAYSPRHKKLVAVLKHDTFVYDVAANTWAKVDTNPAIFGHDAKSVFAYDAHADLFLLAYPPQGQGKKLQMAHFSLAGNKWKLVEPQGPAVPETRYGMYMGYFDPRHNVLVVQGRYSDRMWAYRSKK